MWTIKLIKLSKTLLIKLLAHPELHGSVQSQIVKALWLNEPESWPQFK